MNNNSNGKKNSRAFLIMGLCSLAMALIFLILLLCVENSGVYIPRGDRWRLDLLRGFIIFSFFGSVVNFIVAGVYASKESNENNYFDSIDSNHKYNCDFWSDQSRHGMSNGGQAQGSHNVSISATWTCKKCGSKNLNRNDCWNFGHINLNLKEVDKSFWLCPKCGRENAKYVGTCGCGERQAELKTVEEKLKESQQHTSTAADKVQEVNQNDGQQSNTTNNDIKYCPYCGKAVKEKHVFCSGCGKKLD